MTRFADKLNGSIQNSKSVLVAGLDPIIQTFPKVVVERAAKAATSTEDWIFGAIVENYRIALHELRHQISAIKPNVAFFEQYGIGGMRALQWVLELARDLGIPSIADAKRGDIGSTAQAYANAYCGAIALDNQPIAGFSADAITVNPFLGFDTLEPFFESCAAHDKGIFVLVRTSNPGAIDIQGRKINGRTLSEEIALSLVERAALLMGKCGYSGLGAVVGANSPLEARSLRTLMPTSYFLIPGVGAQGGTVADAVEAFDSKGGGSVVNLSRALFTFSSPEISLEEIGPELARRVSEWNQKINAALNARRSKSVLNKDIA